MYGIKLIEKEPLLKELRALRSCFRARRMLRQIEREADRKAAGIFNNEAIEAASFVEVEE